MTLQSVAPLRFKGVKSDWLSTLPDSGTEMLTISSTGVVSRQAIPSASFGALTGLPSDNAALQSALDAKLNLSGGTMTGKITATATGNLNGGIGNGNNGIDFFNGLITYLNNVGGILYPSYFTVNGGVPRLKLSSHSLLGWGSSTDASVDANVDTTLARNTTGQLDVRADNGLRLRNLANSADANLTAASGTFSNAVSAYWLFGNANRTFMFNHFNIANGFGYTFSPNTTAGNGNEEFGWYRDGSHTVGLIGGTNAERFNLYGTRTDASNYRRLYISSTTGGAFTLGVEGLGTGASGNTLSIGNKLNLISGGNSYSPDALSFGSSNRGLTAGSGSTDPIYVITSNGQAAEFSNSALKLASNRTIDWSGNSDNTGTATQARIAMNAYGQIDSRGDLGFRSRNLANSADAPITAGAITASGNIAVTTSTDTPLSITSSSTNVATFGVTNSSSGIGWAFQVGGSSPGTGAPAGSFTFRQTTSDINTGIIASDGRWFIGQGTPLTSTQFAVVSRAAGNTVGVFRGAASQTGNLTAWQNNSGTVLASVSETGAFTSSDTVTALRLITTTGDVRTSGTQMLFLTSNTTERMRITSSGNVGIGATNPNVGLVIRRTGTDLPSMRLEDGDITIPMTGLSINPSLNANTVSAWSASSSSNGGAQMNGFCNNAAGAIPLALVGYSGSNAPTAPCISFTGNKSNGGTGVSDLSGTELIAGFYAGNGAISPVVTIAANGAIAASGNIARKGSVNDLVRLTTTSGEGTLRLANDVNGLAVEIWTSVQSNRCHFRAYSDVEFRCDNGITINNYANTDRSDFFARNIGLTGILTSGMQTLVADPSTVDITTGLNRMVKNSTSGEVRHWVNDGGTMKSVLFI